MIFDAVTNWLAYGMAAMWKAFDSEPRAIFQPAIYGRDYCRDWRLCVDWMSGPQNPVPGIVGVFPQPEAVQTSKILSHGPFRSALKALFCHSLRGRARSLTMKAQTDLRPDYAP